MGRFVQSFFCALRLTICCAVGALLCWVASGQQTRPLSFAELQAREIAAAAEMNRQELVNLELETARAIQLHNMAFFRRVYSEDFLATSAIGQLLNKSTYLLQIDSSPSQYVSFVASDVRVRIFQDTAVVSSMWNMRGTLHGKSFSRQTRVTHMYVNGTRGWQAVASQETPLPGDR
jgi:hypothetical protein